MTSPVLRFDQRQSLSLSPRLQHAVRLLQLSSLDFAHEVETALGRNPFLEGDEGEGESEAGGIKLHDGALPVALVDSTPQRDGTFADAFADDFSDSFAAPQTGLNDAEAPLGEVDGPDYTDADRDIWQADNTPGPRGGEEGRMTAMDMMTVDTSLADHLHGQLNVLPISLRDMALAKAVVESLDDDGYLRFDLDDIVEATDLEPPATHDELMIALRRVQALDPSGVGARSVQECLLLQLHNLPCPQQRELAQTIITEHLDALAAKDVTALSRKLGRTVHEVDAICAGIRRLDPRPGWRYGSTRVPYIAPDVMVRKQRGVWTVSLNPAVVPRVRLNQHYAELFQRHRNGHQSEMAAHLSEAKWVVRNVEQRFCTILQVAQAIVDRQHHFLDYGPMAMKPLGLREIAQAIGLHESTVSRVTNNKYMATPMGMFELKYFFSRAMATANGGACSATAIRGLIQDMIAGESPTAPLSDAEIARLLARQGLVVARRTVTKYRQLLRIEAVERRRQHT